MRLLRKNENGELIFREFVGDMIPPYAILSHTWLPDIEGTKQEYTYEDLINDTGKEKPGYTKIQLCGEQARQDDLHYFWVDTCCIDKKSSAELSEAINSMYQWYQNSVVCYVYLVDVEGVDFTDDVFAQSLWFQRDWTLQELIAPRNVRFFETDWQFLGAITQQDTLETERQPLSPFAKRINEITGISELILTRRKSLGHCSIAERMSWASKRSTTREEDVAYSLLGLFQVHMLPNYGEGRTRAFKRLQLEIIKTSPDQSIFAWRASRESSGLLANSPEDFIDAATIFPWYPKQHPTWSPTLLPFSMTNMGLVIKLPIIKTFESAHPRATAVAALNCWSWVYGAPHRARIYLQSVHRVVPSHKVLPLYRRIRCEDFAWAGDLDELGYREELYILEDEQANLVEFIDSFQRPKT